MNFTKYLFSISLCLVWSFANAVTMVLPDDFNKAAELAKIPPRVKNCKNIPALNGVGCDVVGIKAGGSIVSSIEKNRTQLNYFAGLKNPEGNNLQEMASVFMLLMLFVDPKLEAERAVKTVTEMMSKGVTSGGEIVRKINGKTYAFKAADLKKLGMGDGYMFSYTAY